MSKEQALLLSRLNFGRKANSICKRKMFSSSIKQDEINEQFSELLFESHIKRVLLLNNGRLSVSQENKLVDFLRGLNRR